MDGINMESGNGLYKDKSRLQALLCRKTGNTSSSDGTAKLSERIQANVAAAYARTSAQMEKISDDICEFDE